MRNYNENWTVHDDDNRAYFVESSWLNLVVMVASIFTNGNWIIVLVSAYCCGDYGNGVF